MATAGVSHGTDGTDKQLERQLVCCLELQVGPLGQANKVLKLGSRRRL
jgi:hypothetical protein